MSGYLVHENGYEDCIRIITCNVAFEFAFSNSNIWKQSFQLTATKDMPSKLGSHRHKSDVDNYDTYLTSLDRRPVFTSLMSAR